MMKSFINKKIITLLCILSITLTVKAQLSYEIIGTVTSVPQGKAVTVNLFYNDPKGRFVHDSCEVVNGKFLLHGEVPAPLKAFLMLTEDHENFQRAFPAFRDKSKPAKVQLGLYLENGPLKAVLDYEHPEDALIIGSINNDAYQEFRGVLSRFKSQSEVLSKKNAALSIRVTNDSILNAFKALNKRRNQEIGAIIKRYPAALANLDMLTNYVSPTQDHSDAEAFYAYLAGELKNSIIGQRYRNSINKASASGLGATAPDFRLPDSTGKFQQLGDLKGKYVLVDFWASWCIPCRQETPNLREAYQQFREKGFEILGISLDGGRDDSRKQWLKAVSLDKMTWPQLSDLRGFSSKTALDYFVTAIPMNFLVDPKGNIIARNLRGSELKALLGKLL